MGKENPPPPDFLKNHFLLFQTYYGDMLGWCIRTGIPVEEISSQIEAAAEEWLLSPDGRQHVQEEQIEEWGFDYANALMNVPAEILAKYHIHLWTPIEEIVKLDVDENLLPEELRASKA